MPAINFSIEEDLPIIILKAYKLHSHIKGYHTYMMKLEPNTWRISQGLIRTRKWIWQSCSCIRKMRCCGGTFIKEAKLVDSQKLFQFFFVEAMKTLAKLKLLRKERALAMGKDSKYSVNSILVEMKNKLKDIFSILL